MATNWYSLPSGPERQAAKAADEQSKQTQREKKHLANHRVTETTNGYLDRHGRLHRFANDDERQVARSMALIHAEPIDFQRFPLSRDAKGKLWIGRIPYKSLVWDARVLKVIVEVMKELTDVGSAPASIDIPAETKGQNNV